MSNITSMVDYIPMQTRNCTDRMQHGGVSQALHLINEYARFLKQPLKLGQFIPCDEQGRTLEPPLKADYGLAEPEFNTYIHPMECYGEDCEDYRKAQERVLFKNVELIYAENTSAGKEPMSESFSLRIDGNEVAYWKSKPKYWIGFKGKTIEDLIPLGIELKNKI